MKFEKVILVVAFLLACLNTHAQTCKDDITPTTPDSRFTTNGNGTVTDNKTKLIWMRCSLGQTWDGATCSGDASTYIWQQALTAAESHGFGGSGAWRLPNIKELVSIVEISCYDPAINQTIFPLTPSGKFWAASPDTRNGAYAWYVGFNYGHDYSGDKNDSRYIRLVRDDGN